MQFLQKPSNCPTSPKTFRIYAKNMLDKHVQHVSNVGHVLRMTRKKVVPVVIPEIVDGMCGLCQNWHKVDEEEEYLSCSMLAVWHAKETKVRRQMTVVDDVGMGPLKKQLRRREYEMSGGFEDVTSGGGEIVPQEDFSDTPRFYINDFGEKVRVWSPLRTAAWFGCSRYARSMGRRVIDEPADVVVAGGQLSLFGEAMG